MCMHMCPAGLEASALKAPSRPLAYKPATACAGRRFHACSTSRRSMCAVEAPQPARAGAVQQAVQIALLLAKAPEP